MAGAAVVIRDLGPVSQEAAAAGVAATAQIAAGEGVTFRFEIEDGGTYTLFVRHDGDGLSLLAKTPAGSASINPGPAGPFQAVSLGLELGTYEVTAATRGGQSAFVDWELLLNSGVGQSTACAGATVYRPTGAMLSVPSGTTNHDSISKALSSSAALPLGSAHGGISWSSLATSPVGRGEFISTTPPRNLAMGPRVVDSPNSPPLANFDSAPLIALQHASFNQPNHASMSADPAWLDGLIYPVSHDLTEDGSAMSPEPGSIAAGTGESTPGKSIISLKAISPGLFLGGIAVTIASRARLKRVRRSSERIEEAPRAPGFGPTMLRLRGVFGRSYRPGRCEPVRPLRRRA